jgi:ABC-type Fe3+ transport system substrate-binding protein
MASPFLKSSVRASLISIAVALAAACAPAAAPAPTTAPAAPPPTTAPAPKADAPKTEAPKAEAPKPTAAPAAQAPAKPDSSAALNALYEKAKASGQMKVSHYGAGLNEFEPVVEAFRQRFPGVSVETSLQRAPETIQRLNAEASAGKQIANVVSHGETAMLTLDQQGAFTDWDGPPTVNLLPKIPATGGRTRWSMNEAVHGFIVNTSLVPSDKIPTTPQSFLDPFFKGKGKLLMEDPRSTGPALDFFTQSSDTFGREYLDKIKAQEVTWTRDRTLAPIQVARGEFAVYFPVSLATEHFQLVQAGGVQVGILKEMPTTTTTSIAVIKGAPDQDAAKLYVAWILSEDGQRTLVEKKEQYASLPGIAPPAGWPVFTDLQLARRTEDQTARNAEYTELFEQVFFK